MRENDGIEEDDFVDVDEDGGAGAANDCAGAANDGAGALSAADEVDDVAVAAEFAEVNF